MAGGRTGVSGDEPDVKVGIDTVHAGNRGDGAIDRVHVPVGADLAVERGDVVVDHHVDVGEIEAFLERAERRSDPVGEYLVADVGIRTPPSKPVGEAVQATAGMTERSAAPLGTVPRASACRDVPTQQGDGADHGQTASHPLGVCSHSSSSFVRLATRVEPPFDRPVNRQ